MYNKKVLSNILAKLDNAKAPAKPKDIITDPMGQWKYPGQNTRIPGNDITMQGVSYPVFAQPNVGQPQMMYPGQDYQFPGADYVDEYPMAKRGGAMPKLPKKKNSKSYSRSLTATNKLFAQNSLTKKNKSKKNKIFDPSSKYYQEGGAQLPEDYSQFTNFTQTLPSNLQDPEYQYGNPDQYDLYGMWNTVGKPGTFKDVQDSDYFPLQDDGTYHGFSVGSDGTLLKPMGHSTTWKEVMNSQLNTDPYFKENRLIKNEQGRLQYVPNKEKGGFQDDINKRRQVLRDWTYGADIGMLQEKNGGYIDAELTDEEIEEYRKGGYIVEDVSVPQLTKAQEGLQQPIIDKAQDEEETFAYAKAADKERWKELMDDTRALMDTAQGRKLWYQDLKPKNFSIDELQRFTKGVKEYNQGAQDYERARRKVQEGKIPTSDFARMYDEKGWGKYDQATMKEGYQGQFQDAADEAQKRKEANMGVTDAVLELTGAPALSRIIQDPMGTLKGVGNTAADIAMSAAPGFGSVFGVGDPNVNPLTGNQYWSGLDKTLDVVGVLPGIGSLGKLGKVGKAGDLISDASKFVTTKTPLKNTYKLNPKVLKENPDVLLHRVQKPGQTEQYILEQYGKQNPKLTSGQPGWGRAFSSDPSDMQYYTNSKIKKQRGYTEDPEILRLKLPKKDIEQYNIYNFNETQKAQGLGPYGFGSSKPTKEFVLPIQDIIKAEKFGPQDLNNLYKEYEAFNTPHWLRGYGKVPNSSSGSDEILKSGFDGNFITRPLTPFGKNELTPGKQWYRKIGNEAGLKDLINKQGAQAPAPMKMKSGLTLDAPFFGKGISPAESYKGLYSVEVKPEAASKYHWKSRVAGVDNYGSVPFANERQLKNLPIEDLNVYRKKWFSNNYKQLDPNNLEEGLKYAPLQRNLETAYKWGIRGAVADQMFNDGDYTKKINKSLFGYSKKQTGGYIDAELTPEEIEWYRSQGYQVENMD
jgi:hypothetical protein